MSTVDEQRDFLQSQTFAVAGASTDREKYGNRVFRMLTQWTDSDPQRSVFPLNPKSSQVEGVPAYPGIAALRQVPQALSIVTPPAITRQIVREAVDAGVEKIWMQPGAEEDSSIELARQHGCLVIAHGPCILVAMKTLAFD